MLQFLGDEDFHGRILRGLLLKKPDLDIVRVQDVGFSGASDEAILDWANTSAASGGVFVFVMVAWRG